jgi:ArsR family transcriptional regulator
MSMQADQRALEFIPAAELQAVAEACSTPLVREPIGESAAAGLAQVFKALADPVRLRLVSLIGAHQGGEVCVCELTTALSLTQPTISLHLKSCAKPGSSTASAAARESTTASCPPRWSAWPRCCLAPPASKLPDGSHPQALAAVGKLGLEDHPIQARDHGPYSAQEVRSAVLLACLSAAMMAARPGIDYLNIPVLPNGDLLGSGGSSARPEGPSSARYRPGSRGAEMATAHAWARDIRWRATAPGQRARKPPAHVRPSAQRLRRHQHHRDTRRRRRPPLRDHPGGQARSAAALIVSVGWC